MKYLYWQDKKSILLIHSALCRDQVVAGTSDTVIGLLAGITIRSFKLLNSIKNRSGKPYLVLIGSIEKAQMFVDSDQLLQIENIVSICWPGPLTLIVRARPEVPDFVKSEQGNIALRVPSHQGLLALLKECDGLFSTSANSAGQPVPTSIDEIDPDILGSLSYVITDREPKSVTIASTILDCTGKEIRVVREGAFDSNQLEKIYGKRFVR